MTSERAIRRRAVPVLASIIVAGLVALAGCVPAPEPEPVTTFENGDFELGSASPRHWKAEVNPGATLTWDDQQAYSGTRSAKIHHDEPTTSRWRNRARIAVQPDTLYRLSGRIRTEGVEVPSGRLINGAVLDVDGPSPMVLDDGLVGDNDWTYVDRVFNTRNAAEIVVSVGLGLWGSASGTAWFDDLRLAPVEPSSTPDWHIQVLIYGATDHRFTDDDGVERHVVARMSEAERVAAQTRASTFVETDLPLLSSGLVDPHLTVTYIDEPLTRLSRVLGGWWPTPTDTAGDRDPSADSVIVIWDPRTVDVDTGESIWIGAAAGLAFGVGTGQLYSSLIIEAAAHYGHGNVFKHEWGHSIVSYFAALGISPLPTVNVHAEPDEYVNCQTGQPYVWQDEVDGAPIPNSIYNNESGFTHDYYSGTIATADRPDRCIGITPYAWSFGGPASVGTLDVSQSPVPSVAVR